MGFQLPNSFINNQSLKIAIVGAGGTGSHLTSKIALLKRTLDALSREETPLCNIAQIDIFDTKKINEFALARGLFTVAEIGINKAVALASRYNILLGENVFTGYEKLFEATFASNYDIVITTVDQAKIRVEIGNTNHRGKDILWLDCGVSKSEFSVILGELGHRIGKLPNALDLTDLDSVDDTQNLEPSCSVMQSIERQVPFVNDINASFSLSLLSQLLLQGKITVNGCITDVNTLRSTPIDIHNDTYLQFGYDNFQVTTH